MSNAADFPNGIPDMVIAADWAVARYDLTDMVVYRDESDPFPDVKLNDYNYGPSTSWVALTQCPTYNTGTGGAHPNRWCRNQRNIFNTYFYWYETGVYDDQYQRRKLTCHEMGHTVGLRHNTVSTDSCIWTYY
ncbi:MAG: hypothetical protein ACRC0L_05650, partial [Angustibacter sp.]